MPARVVPAPKAFGPSRHGSREPRGRGGRRSDPENGRGRGRAGEAPPFQALQDEADAADQTVEEWCAENGQHPGGGNGQGRG
jgi:hypothetical protein